jgi:hypothetical protein
MRPDLQVFTAKPRGMALSAAGRNLALSTIDAQERAARALAHRADVLSRNWSAVLSDEWLGDQPRSAGYAARPDPASGRRAKSFLLVSGCLTNALLVVSGERVAWCAG